MYQCCSAAFHLSGKRIFPLVPVYVVCAGVRHACNIDAEFSHEASPLRELSPLFEPVCMMEHYPGMVSFVGCDGRAVELRGWFSWSLRLLYFPVCQQPDVSPSCDNTFGHAAVSVSASYLVLVISHVVRNDADMFDIGGFSLVSVAHV